MTERREQVSDIVNV